MQNCKIKSHKLTVSYKHSFTTKHQPHQYVQITDYTYPLLDGTRAKLKFENKNIVTTLNIISIIENFAAAF